MKTRFNPLVYLPTSSSVKFLTASESDHWLLRYGSLYVRKEGNNFITQYIIYTPVDSEF